MADRTNDSKPALAADEIRRTLVEAALRAYEDAGLSGLCTEGRWEAAVSALRSVDLSVGPSEHVARERVVATAPGDATLAEFAAAVAAPAPAPGGGSVAAVAGMLAAALAQMVARLTVGRPRYSAVDAQMREVALRAAALGAELVALAARDGAASADVAAAYRLPPGPEAIARARAAAIERTLLHATEVPLDIARAAAEVAELGALVAEHGNANAVAEGGVAALLAEAACRGAGYAVRVNVAAMGGTAADASVGSRFAEEASALVTRAGLAAGRAAAAVERACSR